VTGDLYLAHSFTPGGPEIEVLLLAGALLYLGVYLFVRKAAKPIVSVALVVAALAFGIGAFSIGGSSAASTNVRIEITSPDSGATVEANTPVEVRTRVRGGRLVSSTDAQGTDVGHLHVYVDDNLVAMPTAETYPVELRPGRHTVTVEFTRADHGSFSPQVTDEIELTAR
jgi:hypothetical protein